MPEAAALPLVLRRATMDDVEAIVAISRGAVAAGEMPEIDDADLDDERNALLVFPGGAIVAEADGVVVGYIGPRLNSIGVSPAHRRHGIGTALLEAGIDFVRERGEPYLLLYVPAADTPGRRFALARGFVHRATLHGMVRPVDLPCPAPEPHDGTAIRAFVPDTDSIPALVSVMNRSFADHPTVVTWRTAEVAARHAREEFDPGLLALAVTPDERPVGFTWCSIEDRDGRSVGDIRLIGVVPEARGRGLGRALLRWGIRTLQARDVSLITLSVVAANDPALRLYLAHDFADVRVWPQWSRDA